MRYQLNDNNLRCCDIGIVSSRLFIRVQFEFTCVPIHIIMSKRKLVVRSSAPESDSSDDDWEQTEESEFSEGSEYDSSSDSEVESDPSNISAEPVDVPWTFGGQPRPPYQFQAATGVQIPSFNKDKCS